VTTFPDLNPKDRGTVFFIAHDETDPHWLEEQRVRDHIDRAKRMLETLSSERTTFTDQPAMIHDDDDEGCRQMTWRTHGNGMTKAEINHHRASMSFRVYDVDRGRTTMSYKIDDIEMDDVGTARRMCSTQDAESFRTTAMTCMGLIIESLEAMMKDRDPRVAGLLETMLGASHSAMAYRGLHDVASTITTARTPWSTAMMNSWPMVMRAGEDPNPARRRALDTIRKLPCCIEVEIWSDGVTLTAADVYAYADPTQSSPLDRMRALAAYERAAGSEPDA
jgi:hypothetical protein